MKASPLLALRLFWRRRALLGRLRQGERIRLEIGSGEHPQPGYVHLDLRPDQPGLDLVADLARGMPLPPGVADEVLANHVVEHLSWRTLPFVLREVHRVLRPEGRFLLRTPDADCILADLVAGRGVPLPDGDQEALEGALGEMTPFAFAVARLYSSQDHPGNFHNAVYDFTHLRRLLERSGFVSVGRARGLAIVSPGEMVIEAFASQSGRDQGWREPFPAVTTLVGWVARAQTELPGLLRRAWAPFMTAALRTARRRTGTRRHTRPPLPAAVKRVLVFNVGGLGDFARMAPFLARLRSLCPQARITLVCSSAVGDVRLWRAFHDEAFTWTPGPDFDRRFARAAGAAVEACCERPGLVKRLRSCRFDLGFAVGRTDAEGNLGSALLDVAGVGYRIGVHRSETSRCLDLDVLVDDATLSVHDAYDRALAPFGAAIEHSPCALAVEEASRVWARRYLAMSGMPAAASIVVLHPGSSRRALSRRWPAERFAELGDRVNGLLGVPVVLTGSNAEVGLVREVAERMRSGSVVTAGVTTVAPLCGLLGLADLVIGSDTAVLHLAAGAGAKRVLGIFGPTHHARVLPTGDPFTAVQSRLDCSPCARFDGGKPDRGCTREIAEECLQAISVNEVWKHVEPLLLDRAVGKG